MLILPLLINARFAAQIRHEPAKIFRGKIGSSGRGSYNRSHSCHRRSYRVAGL